MLTTNYEMYSASDLVISGNTLTLVDGYDGSNDVLLTVNDDDDIFEGDLDVDDDGNDTNQFGTATLADGTVIGGPTTTVYSESQILLTAPDGTTITLQVIEIDSDPNSNIGAGIFVGYLPSVPLEKGVIYTGVGSNTIPGNSLEYGAIEGAVCFTRGTLITTPDGPVPVEDLAAGMMVETRNGPHPIRWIGARHYDATALAANDRLYPVRIRQGSLGLNLPHRDLLVSRQHRMLVSSPIAERMFGSRDALVAAIRLTKLPGIDLDDTVSDVEYFHILFDEHQVILAEGAPSESLFTGPEALKTLEPEMLEEIMTIFPQMADDNLHFSPACTVPSRASQQRLVMRHRKNNRDLLTEGSATV
ncbi:Hint domain-containing protein [Paracoccus sp. R86501]|uniref:Hint domain-containing protein n=1 Tax=Paracoccus sp. R86501 TaxID=3101711 RepID=UPI00366B301F